MARFQLYRGGGIAVFNSGRDGEGKKELVERKGKIDLISTSRYCPK